MLKILKAFSVFPILLSASTSLAGVLDLYVAPGEEVSPELNSCITNLQALCPDTLSVSVVRDWRLFICWRRQSDIPGGIYYTGGISILPNKETLRYVKGEPGMPLYAESQGVYYKIPPEKIYSPYKDCGPANGAVIKSIRVAQVVYDPKHNGATTLVQGKSAALEITLEKPDASVATGEVTVEARIGTDAPLTMTVPVASIDPSKPIDMSKFKFIPKTLGSQDIKVKITQGDKELGSKTIPVNVIETRIPKYALVPFGDCEGSKSCYGSVSMGKYRWFKEWVDSFFQTGFPFADEKFEFIDRSSKPFKPNTFVESSVKALHRDIAKLWYEQSFGGVERVVGVVPEKYIVQLFKFKYKDPSGIRGFIYSNYERRVAVVKETAPISVAHEIGHTYGMEDLYITGNEDQIPRISVLQ